MRGDKKIHKKDRRFYAKAQATKVVTISQIHDDNPNTAIDDNIVIHTAGENLTGKVGEFCYLHTDGKVYQAMPHVNNLNRIIGVILTGADTDESVLIQIAGRYDGAYSWAGNSGAGLYIRESGLSESALLIKDGTEVVHIRTAKIISTSTIEIELPKYYIYL